MITGVETTIINEEENEEEKRVSLSVITGGRDGIGSGDTWLEKLPLGTLFLIQHKHPSNDWNLGEFCLLGKTSKACILASQEIPRPIKVDPNRFCKAYTCYEELAILDTKDILKDTEDTLGTEIDHSTIVREPELVVDNTKD